MNKGLQIRNNKLKKKQQKRNTITPEQFDLCRFVELEWKVIERVNGKYKHTGQSKGKGLQIKNRVYLLNGSYKLVNSKSVRIFKIYDNIPEWASENLIKQYIDFNKYRKG